MPTYPRHYMEVSGQLRPPPRAALARGRSSITHWIGSRVDPRAGLGAVAKRKSISAPAGNRIPLVQPVA
jgi:hypothetical protein